MVSFVGEGALCGCYATTTACDGAVVCGSVGRSNRQFRSIAIVVNFIKSLCGERLLDDRSVLLYVLYSITASLFLVVF